jgi:DNA-binding MarR family transcriptional regulator
MMPVQTQMVIFWRILQMLISRYGNHPTGQLLVALTMILLNERGMPPTLSQICAATGLPKASVSRYVSWQIKEGLVVEKIDADDRRRRYLEQTAKGRREWQWQMKQIDKLFTEVTAGAEVVLRRGVADTAAEVLETMAELTNNAPPRIPRDRS